MGVAIFPQDNDVLAGDLKLGWDKFWGGGKAKLCHVCEQCKGLGLEVDVPLQLLVANVDVA